MLERFIYKRFCLNETYAINCAHVRHFCYCRYIYRRGSERKKIPARDRRVKIWLFNVRILPDQRQVNLL